MLGYTNSFEENELGAPTKRLLFSISREHLNRWSPRAHLPPPSLLPAEDQGGSSASGYKGRKRKADETVLMCLMCLGRLEVEVCGVVRVLQKRRRDSLRRRVRKCGVAAEALAAPGPRSYTYWPPSNFQYTFREVHSDSPPLSSSHLSSI